MGSIESDRERLSQSKMIKWLKRDIAMTEMVKVYSSDGMYCALIPTSKAQNCLFNISWDLMHGWGMPGAIEYYEGKKKRIDYLRYGDDHGIEPLVVDREFHGMRDDYVEICEEFRLFHKLYHDRKQDRYFKYDDSGNEHLIAIVERHNVQIRLKEIRQFLAIKEMYLSLQFDYREHSVHTLEELGLEKGNEENRGNLLCWGLFYGDLGCPGTDRAFSRLLGKRLIPPLPKEKSGLWGFTKEDPKKYVEFIIGLDEAGNEIIHTSNPGKLANYFGANPKAPHYLTPVQFRKQVLDKYYQQPKKYSIKSGILYCGSLWCVYIDNHFEDRVAAWLGDLGRDLPYEEQLHWRSFNIPPTGGVSETYFRRQILAQRANSDRPEHLFRDIYDKVQSASEEYLGWQILLPLAQDDFHYLKAIRVPSTDEQKDFDDLVLALTKILVDSLNEKELNKIIPASERNEIKSGISRLERILQMYGFSEYESHIQFLRNLQNLRSAGTAHRKGNNYQKIAKEFNVDSQSLSVVFEGILILSIRFLDFLESVVHSKKLIVNRDAK